MSADLLSMLQSPPSPPPPAADNPLMSTPPQPDAAAQQSKPRRRHSTTLELSDADLLSDPPSNSLTATDPALEAVNKQQAMLAASLQAQAQQQHSLNAAAAVTDQLAPLNSHLHSSSHPPSSSSSSSTSSHHQHQPPTLQLQGISHLEQFYPPNLSMGLLDPLSGSISPVNAHSPAHIDKAPGSATSSPTTQSLLGSSYEPLHLSEHNLAQQQQLDHFSPTPLSPSFTVSSTISPSSSMNALTVSPIPLPTPITPNTSTGYTATMIHTGQTPLAPPQQQQQPQQQQMSSFSAPNANGHPPPAAPSPHGQTHFFGVRSPQQPYTQLHPAQTTQQQHQQQQQQQQQQPHQQHPAANPQHPQHQAYLQHLQQQQQQPQQRATAAANNNITSTSTATHTKKGSGGFFSSLLFGIKKETTPTEPIHRPPPLPIYMARLRRCHEDHLQKLAKCAESKKKYEQRSIEEIQQWNNWAIPSLASIAASYYHTLLLYVNTTIQLYSKYMDNLIDHIHIANAVCEGKLSEKVMEKEMLAADGSVKSQEEIYDMFWPPEAPAIRAHCRALLEQAKKMELTYNEMQQKAKKRENVSDRRKRLVDWLSKAHTQRDSLPMDTFHHHPVDGRTQLAFNIMMTDQRGDEGKLVRRFMDMQQTHKSKMTPHAIMHFINVLIAQTLKTYQLDERVISLLRLYTERLIFCRIQPALNALVTAEEREKTKKFQMKLSWLRTLSPEQLGLPEECVPPDYKHQLQYAPLFTPPLVAVHESPPTTNNTVAAAPSSLSVSNLGSTAGAGAGHPPVSSPTPAVPADDPGSPLPDGQSTSPVGTASTVAGSSEMFAYIPNNSNSDDSTSPKNMVPDEFPYANAINCLTQLNFDDVPFDMFFRVVFAVRLVTQAAKQYQRMNREARARAQARKLTYDDPFTAFMTKLVDDSNRQAQELEQKEQEEKERKAAEAAAAAQAAKEAEQKKQELHARKLSVPTQTGQAAAAGPAPTDTHPPAVIEPVPAATAAAASASVIVQHPDTQQTDSHTPAAETGHTTTAETHQAPPATSTTSSTSSDHQITPPTHSTPTLGAAFPVALPPNISLNNPHTPTKPVIDHPLAPTHVDPTIVHHTLPAPVPEIPEPSPPIPERPFEESPLSADQLFPLIVWVVIHSNVPSFPIKLGHSDRFVPAELKDFGEAGWSATQVEQAVSYLIDKLTPENLGKPIHITLDEMHETPKAAAHSHTQTPPNAAGIQTFFQTDPLTFNASPPSTHHPLRPNPPAAPASDKAAHLSSVLSTPPSRHLDPDDLLSVNSPAQLLHSPSNNLMSPNAPFSPSTARPSHSTSYPALQSTPSTQERERTHDHFADINAGAMIELPDTHPSHFIPPTAR